MTTTQVDRALVEGPYRDDIPSSSRCAPRAPRLSIWSSSPAPRDGALARPGRARTSLERARRTLLTALLALVALLVAPGCAATSDYMTELASPRPILGSPTMATVVFIRPSSFARNLSATLLDGRGTFLGDSLPESHFIVQLPPGQHLFIAWAENTAALQATLAPGRVYYVEVAPKLGALSARVHLLSLTPRSENWAEVDQWLLRTRQLQPDAAAGQRYLASRAEDVQERIRRANDAIANYDEEELAERTLRPEDGR